MKKKLLTTFLYLFILILIPIGHINAFEMSLGFSLPGVGLPILRGGYTHAASVSFAEEIQKQLPISVPGIGISFAPLLSLDLMFEILPYLAIETGAGIGITAIGAQLTRGNETAALATLGLDMVFPLMLRGQYEFGRVVIYASVGPKFQIKVGNSFLPIGGEAAIIPYLDTNNINTNTINIDTNALINDGISLDGLTNTDGSIKDNINFSDIPSDALEAIIGQNTIALDSFLKIDIAIALGIEFRLADANYLGLRFSYDFGIDNLLKGLDYSELYIDSFAVSFTYRYAFDSKWKYF